MPPAGYFRCAGCCSLSGDRMRVQSNRRTAVCVHVGRSHLTEIDDPHGAATDPTVGSDCDTVSSATVGFDDDEEPFVSLWDFQAEQRSRQETHPYAGDLAGTRSPLVQPGTRLEEFAQSWHDGTYRAGAMRRRMFQTTT